MFKIIDDQYYETIELPLTKLSHNDRTLGLLVRRLKYEHSPWLELHGMRADGSLMPTKSLGLHWDVVPALIHALQLLDAGPLGRLALQAEYDRTTTVGG